MMNQGAIILAAIVFIFLCLFLDSHFSPTLETAQFIANVALVTTAVIALTNWKREEQEKSKTYAVDAIVEYKIILSKCRDRIINKCVAINSIFDMGTAVEGAAYNETFIKETYETIKDTPALSSEIKSEISPIATAYAVRKNTIIHGQDISKTLELEINKEINKILKTDNIKDPFSHIRKTLNLHELMSAFVDTDRDSIIEIRDNVISDLETIIAMISEIEVKTEHFIEKIINLK